MKKLLFLLPLMIVPLATGCSDQTPKSEDKEVMYLGEHKITKTGDYSTIDQTGRINYIYYSKETNTLTLRNAVITEAQYGSYRYTDEKDVHCSFLITYTGSKAFTVNLFGENRFTLVDGTTSSYTKGVFLTTNENCNVTFNGPGHNHVIGASRGFVKALGNATIKDCIIESTKTGRYGIDARFLNIVDSTIGLFADNEKAPERYERGIYASIGCTMLRTTYIADGFADGIYTNTLRVQSSNVSITKAQFGIYADWIYCYGDKNDGLTENTTVLTISAKINAVKTLDLQEYQFCTLNMEAETDTVIYAPESTIRFYNCNVTAVSESGGDGIQSFRILISDSDVYVENHADKHAGIRCSSCPLQPSDPDKQPYVSIVNSHIKSVSTFAAICGLGALKVNNVEGFENADCHYLNKAIGQDMTWLTVWGLFPKSAEDFEILRESKYNAVPKESVTSIDITFGA